MRRWYRNKHVQGVAGVQFFCQGYCFARSFGDLLIGDVSFELQNDGRKSVQFFVCQ